MSRPSLPLILIVSFLGFRGIAVGADPPMNLLVIQTDEHNFRTLGCYRDTLPADQALIWGEDAVVETPAIDSIAARGAICTSFYATSPVCTPSRASLFSGLYPQRTGSPQNNLPMNSDVVTFAEVLRADGYATGYAGKWHLDGPGKPQWQPRRKFGFDDNRFMFNRGHWKQFELTDDGPRVAARNARDQPTYGVEGADEKSFSTDWLADRAIEFIRKNSAGPFCYHLSLPDPHGPNTVRPPYDDMYMDRVIRSPMTFSMVKDNPAWAAPQGKNGTMQFNAASMARYFGMVRCIDDNVGKILKVLDQLDLTDRTMIVFTSDHGDLCYEHGRLNKGNPYEGSAKVPMLLAAPGVVPAGTRIDHALGTVDFMPTVLSLLGKDVKQEFDGRDASGFFRGTPPADWNDITFLRAAGAGPPSWLAAVTDRYKLVVSTSERPWLFDLQSDPNELKNAIGQEENRQTVRRLAKELMGYGESSAEPQFKKGPLMEQLQSLSKVDDSASN
ncbi:sulfatase [Roseiconus nitratireducens]|uniref:Sulfatase n=1 Tax=Roseiconus nitratireducens TaxID=2605748 RepID=A0A5M6DHR8_9BACT|nr:sulfatase [Roseiconus nitratireducens]KAA5545916.1 sulfatase [Roseiconus nitratireducens]